MVLCLLTLGMIFSAVVFFAGVIIGVSGISVFGGMLLIYAGHELFTTLLKLTYYVVKRG